MLAFFSCPRLSFSPFHSFCDPLLCVYLPPSFLCCSGLFCNMSIDPIGTCWPKSTAGQWVSRPCPEMFYGVKYNTTSE
uniref:G-protein coupled receptors family 2 profile 1 domain-containing protein n=1 Tax=Hucho hucho TaxID=62062 RepID=A0A4W5R5R2_9TELE